MSSRKAFVKILSFLNELNECFGHKHDNINKYYRLLKNVDKSNEYAINKNVKVFEDWYANNKSAVTKKTHKLIVDPTIKFSDRVFINIADLIKEADQETKDIIWSHLQIILLIIQPSDEVISAVEATAKAVETVNNDIPQLPFNTNNKSIKKIMNKMQTAFQQKQFANESEALSSLMNPGMFGELVETMNKDIESGELTLAGLVSDVQEMVGNVTGQQIPNLSAMMGMLGGMMGNEKDDLNSLLQQATGDEIDIEKLMKQMELEEEKGN
jgi:hypothetical protein